MMCIPVDLGFRVAIRLRVPAAVALMVFAAPLSPSSAAGIADYLPADSLVVVLGRPIAGATPASAPTSMRSRPSVLQQLLVVASQLKVLPSEARLAGDILGCHPLLEEYPYAFALLDVSARRLPTGGYRLDRMQAALVFDTGGDDRAIAQRIRQLLAAYTNSELGRLEKSVSGGVVRYRLRESRLPEWAVIEWGARGRLFVVSIGEGAFDRILAVPNAPDTALAKDPWYARAHSHSRGDRAFFEWTIPVAELRRRLTEVIHGRVEQTLASLGAEKVERLFGAVRYDGRAVVMQGVIRADGADSDFVLSEAVTADDLASAAVPAEATRYAMLRIPLAELIRRSRDACLASQSPVNQEQARAIWSRMEAEERFDTEADFLAHLGTRLIVHDYPLHPLRLPLLWTFLIETDGVGDGPRRAIDGMMRFARAALADKIARDPGTTLAPQILCTSDGLWYLRLGLAGPAVGVCGRWIVISFSPEAVRQTMARLSHGDVDRPAGLH